MAAKKKSELSPSIAEQEKFLAGEKKKLAKKEIINILCEGGAALNSALIDAGLVDKVLFYISPKIIGGENAVSAVSGKGISKISKAINIKKTKRYQF